MVASHDHGFVAVSSLVVRSENGMRTFPILDRAGICDCVERGVQAPLRRSMVGGLPEILTRRRQVLDLLCQLDQ